MLEVSTSTVLGLVAPMFLNLSLRVDCSWVSEAKVSGQKNCSYLADASSVLSMRHPQPVTQQPMLLGSQLLQILVSLYERSFYFSLHLLWNEVPLFFDWKTNGYPMWEGTFSFISKNNFTNKRQKMYIRLLNVYHQLWQTGCIFPQFQIFIEPMLFHRLWTFNILKNWLYFETVGWR